MADWVGLSTEDDRISLRCTCDRPAGKLPSRWTDSRLPWRVAPPAERPLSSCGPPPHSGWRIQFETSVPLLLIQHVFAVQYNPTMNRKSIKRIPVPAGHIVPAPAGDIIGHAIALMHGPGHLGGGGGGGAGRHCNCTSSRCCRRDMQRAAQRAHTHSMAMSLSTTVNGLQCMRTHHRRRKALLSSAPPVWVEFVIHL